jgi:hypothetical protein
MPCRGIRVDGNSCVAGPAPSDEGCLVTQEVILTAAGRLQHWNCSKDGNCQIEVGSMSAGAAEIIHDSSGLAFVRFYCALNPNPLGAEILKMGGKLETNWNQNMVVDGKECLVRLGPDGKPD